MSFTLDLASSLLRSPGKKRNKARHRKNEEEASELSPTRVADFPGSLMEEENEDSFFVGSNEEEESSNGARESVIRNLSLAPLHGPLDISATQMDIVPINPAQRRKQKKVKVLPALDETTSLDPVATELMDNANTGGFTLKIKKKSNSALPKPTRAERIQQMMQEATELAGTGDEEEAIKVYKKAIKIADNEVNKLKDQLKKSVDKHPATLKSIQTRLQEDMLQLVLQAGKIKTEMTHLYERTGEYDNAIQTCREAKALYKKQKKRCPPDDDSTISSKFSGTTGTTGTSSLSDGATSVVWYVQFPDIDTLIKDASALLYRLTKAQSTYEDRKQMVEEILLLRQEIVTAFDPNHRKALYARAEAKTKKFLQIERSTLGNAHPQIADTLQLLSDLALEQRDKPGSRDRAIQYLLEGLDINQKSLGKMHPRTGQDLLRMARVYQQPAIMGMSPDDPKRRQDEDRAVTYFHSAADVFRRVDGGHKVVGSILNDLAVIYVARRDYRKSLQLLQESLQSFEYETSSDDEDTATTEESSSHVLGGVCIDVVQVWRNMGECHMNLKDFGKAIECFVKALDIQRDIRKKHDTVSDFELDSVSEEKSFLVHLMQLISDESLADTLRRLGKAFHQAGKLKEAQIVLREAMGIHRTAVDEAGGAGKCRVVSPELPTKLDQLANTVYCIAEVCSASEQYNQAVKIFNESMQLRIASDGHRPEKQRCNMVHCAMCLVGIANVHQKKQEYVESHKLYNDALFFCEAQGLPFTHPLVSMIDGRRKEVEEHIANDPQREKELLKLEEDAEKYRFHGQYDKAIMVLGEALKMRQAAIQKFKAVNLDASSEISATVRLLHSFGHVFSQKGDDEKAQRAHRDAIRLYEKHRPLKPKVTAK